MSDELSVSSLQTMLEDLVDWELVAIHLPGMTHPMIQIIKKSKQGNVEDQKLALYAKWLKVYPSAEWNDVIYALKKAREGALVKKIEQRVGRIESAPVIEKHVAIIEKSVVTELQQLSELFEELLTFSEKICHKLVLNKTVNLDDLLKPFLSYEVHSLQNATSVSQLFKCLRDSSVCTFLDIEALEIVVKILPATELKSKISVYRNALDEFGEKTEIQNLKNKLQPLVCKAQFEEIKLHVIFKMERTTGKLNMSRVKTLVKTLFSESIPLMWYQVLPGSICLVFVSYREYSQLQLDTMSKSLEKRHGFLQLLGVVSLSVVGINGSIFKYEHKATSTVFSFESSLLQASSTANVEALQFLLNVIEVDVNYQDPACKTALFIAVEHNHIEIAQILLNAKANPNHQMGDNGNTYLHIACYKGYTQLATMLIEYGADPSITNTKQDTPLLSSIRGNMIEVVRKAIPKVPQSQIPSALLLACRLGYSDIISFILQYLYPSNSTLHQYCANGELALTAEHIVQFYEDVNCTVTLGITPLMIASSCGHIEVVECLIDAKPDVVNCVDEDGYSPLAYAITGSKSVSVVESLLKAGANPVQGRVSVLKLAKQGNSNDIVFLLLQFMAPQLHHMFSLLVKKVHEDLTQEINEHGKTTLQEIKKKVQTELIYIDGLAEVNDLSELFDILKPFYDFLSWKAISTLSGRLKQEGYFEAVKEFEKEVEIGFFSQLQATTSSSTHNVVSPTVTPTTVLPSLDVSSSCCSVISFSLHRQWSTRTLFNLKRVTSLLFTSLTQFMSHLTVTSTQQEILVSYNIPKSTKLAVAVSQTVSHLYELSAILGVSRIQLNNDVLLLIEIDASFKLEMALINTLRSTLISSSSKVEIVKRVLTLKGIDVNNYHYENGLTALHLASNNPENSVELVDMLLSHGALSNARSHHGQTPLMAAAYVGHYGIVERFVSNDVDLVNTPDKERRTPLMYACFHGHSSIVEYLLKKGANPNSLSDSGETAIVVACFRQHPNVNVLQLLLEARADPNLGNASQKSCLMVASVQGNIEAVKILLHHNANYKYTYNSAVNHCGITMMDAFGFACASGSTEVVDVYLNMTKLSDTSLSIGWYIACLVNHSHLIKHLVNALPQLSIRKRELVLACVEGDILFIKRQLGGGNPDDELFVHGVTPLMIACSCGNVALVKVLLDAGASMTIDEFGYNTASYCSKSSQIRNILGTKFGHQELNVNKPTFDKTFLHEFSSEFPVSKGLIAPYSAPADALETNTITTW